MSYNPRKRPSPDEGGVKRNRVPFECHPRGSASGVSTAAHCSKEDGWAQLTEWVVDDDPEYGLEQDGLAFEQMLNGDVVEDDSDIEMEGENGTSAQNQAGKKPKSQVSKRPHVIWKNLHRQNYLDEMLRWSGRGDFQGASQCPSCTVRVEAGLASAPGAPLYRCKACFQPELLCQNCCLSRHKLLPLHRIQKWTGETFVPVSLKSLGLSVQLNHTGMWCSQPTPCDARMYVLHTNGIHEVSFRYCGCRQSRPHHEQLLRRGFYPASQLSVRTCATFELLDLLHKMALTSKSSTYDFYRGLEKLTDNTGLAVPHTRYRALFRMNQQWRHLKMLKWSGRGQVENGVASTEYGELAIVCPSCPHPDINLPSDWKVAVTVIRFLYALFICLDANFRLKNQIVSNYDQDPGLGTGLSYLVPRQQYEQYVRSRTNDEDISTCVGLQALAQANTRNSSGLRYTGVGAASCGRSEMILPLGVGNLHKGERYANMDYVFGSSIRAIAVLLVLVSYDIACQWFINLNKRMTEHWPEELKIPDTVTLVPAIPKLHHAMHERTGHDVYSLNLLRGVGDADLEGPERIWAAHNPLANSTKTQGPGNRHDTLDDHFGFWNWLKYSGQGKSLATKYRRAIAARNLQSEGHRGLSESLDPKLVAEWTVMCETWEADGFPKTAENPYQSKEATDLSEAEVTETLLQEERQRIEEGGRVHETTAVGFVTSALEIEDTQRRVRRHARALAALEAKQKGKVKDAQAKATLAKHQTELSQQRNILRQRFRAWEKLLPSFMPGLHSYRQSLENAPGTTDHAPKIHPEDFELWLPSRIESTHRIKVAAEHVPDIEQRLRLAQASDSLQKLRHVLQVKTRMIFFKNQNVRGQREGTRSRAVIDRIYEKAHLAAEKYRSARQALVALIGADGEWTQTYRVLLNKDIRGYQDPERPVKKKGRKGTLEDNHPANTAESTPSSAVDIDEIVLEVDEHGDYEPTGETRRTLSWIWTTSSLGIDDDELLRIEWAKSRARELRATEEVILVKEEMRRVRVFLEWKARWWEDRKAAYSPSGIGHREGLSAFAQSQANLQRALEKSFHQMWETALKSPEQDSPEDDTDGAYGEGREHEDDEDGGEERNGEGEDAEDDEDDFDD